MTRVPATEAKNRFGELLQAVRREPVEISRKGRSVAVMLSATDYEEMRRKVESLTPLPRIDGIVDWINRHPGQGAPIDEQDYFTHWEKSF